MYINTSLDNEITALNVCHYNNTFIIMVLTVVRKKIIKKVGHVLAWLPKTLVETFLLFCFLLPGFFTFVARFIMSLTNNFTNKGFPCVIFYT